MASSDVYVPPDSTKEEIDATILRVSSKQKEWAELPVFVKLSLLREVIENAKAELHEWPITAARGHGYNPEDPEQAHLVAEMYLKGPVMLASWLRSTVRLYVSLDTTGAPPAPTSSEKRPNGDYSVKVFPQNVLETALADGSQGFLYTDQPVKQFNPLTLPAGVVGVLGAGNFDAPTDILGALFLENKVVVFKPNPVNHHSAIHIQRIFKPLVDAGYLGFVFGAREAGSAVVDNARISELCLTGSCMTYDAIVWGPGVKKPKADEKSDVKPRVTKPFKAELGSVNPYIICPGKWSESELNAHAEQLASSKMFNNAHICASPQVLVTCKKWPQREQFLNRVQQLLARSPPTRPFYPMCDKSYAEQLEKLSQTLKKNPKELIVANPALFPNQQHPIFARDVPTDAFVVQKEAFCPVLAEVPLDTEPTAEAFLPAAVKYCNEKVWGSLTCTLIVDSRTEAQSKAVVQKAVDDLEFGAIGVNQVAMFVVLFGQLVWGAYPRHSRYDIQSGMGKMGNTLCLEGIKKAVLWAPFTFPSMNKVPVNRKGQLLKAQRTADFLLHWNFYRLSKLLVNVLTGF